MSPTLDLKLCITSTTYEHFGERLKKFPFRRRVTVCIDAFVLQYKLQGWVANTFK